LDRRTNRSQKPQRLEVRQEQIGNNTNTARQKDEERNGMNVDEHNSAQTRGCCHAFLVLPGFVPKIKILRDLLKLLRAVDKVCGTVP